MPVNAGDKLKIRAADWNKLQAVLRWWDRTGGNFPGGPGGSLAPVPIQIKNTTASDVSAFGVLAIDAPIIDFSANTGVRFDGISFDGIAPLTATPHYGKFAVLQEPATKNGGFARAVIAGETLVKLNIADADDVACDIENNVTTYLKTGMSGAARILWKSTGTGSSDKWGLIRIGEAIWGWARMSAELSALSSATARVWHDVAGTMTDTGADITVHDKLLMTGAALATLTRIRWEYDPIKGKYYAVNAACDVDTSSTIWGT